MTTVSICRTCLASNIKMYHIANTPYQDIFEKLATKLQTEDGRPQTVCYVCVSQLRRCRRFMDMSRQADEILTYFHQNSIQLSEEAINILDRKFVRKVTRTPLQFMSLNDPLEHTTRAAEMQIKEEPIEMKEKLSVVTAHQPIAIKKQPNWLKGELHAMEGLPTGLKEQINVKMEHTENEDQLTESALTGLTENKLTGIEQNNEVNVKQEIKQEMDSDNDNGELATELEIEVPEVVGSGDKSDGDTGREGASGQRHQCELCDKSYAHKFHLYRHLRTHRSLSLCRQQKGQWKTSSDGGNYEEADFSDDDTSQNKIDEIKKRKDALNKIRCQRYRDKKKKVKIQVRKEPASTLRVEEVIQCRKEYDKLKSQRYRDRKRASKLVQIQTELSKTGVRHVSKCQHFYNSQTGAPSTHVPLVPPVHTADPSARGGPYLPEARPDDYNEIRVDPPSHVNNVPQLRDPAVTHRVPSTPNDFQRDIQSNTHMHSQRNLPGQTYSSFKRKASAHGQFQNDF